MLVNSPCGWANELHSALSSKKKKEALLRSSDHTGRIFFLDPLST